MAVPSLPVFHTDAPLLAPAPARLLWESPFWAVLLYVAFVPGSITPWWTIGDLPLRSAEGCLIFAGLWYGLASLVRLAVGLPARRPAALVTVFVTVCLWGCLSTVWSGLDSESEDAMRLTLLCSGAAAVLAWGLLNGYSKEEVQQFLWRLTAWLVLVSLIYSTESILALGLRTEMGQNTLVDFGIERVKGPLYGSSTGYFLLLPALAFAVQEAIYVRRRRTVSIVMALILLTALLGLGSRAALILLATYLGMISLLVKSAKKRLIGIGLTVSLCLTAAVTIFSQASTERLHNFDDDSRKLTYRTAWRAVEDGSWTSALRGSGYGAIWNWYLTDARNGERLAAGDNVVQTASGFSLYHSHSTFLTSAVELGLPGIAGFCLLIALLFGVAMRSWQRRQWQPLAYGLCVTALAFFFDLFLFKNTTVNAVWWLYAAGVTRLMEPSGEDRCA